METPNHELSKVSVRAPGRRVLWMLIGVSLAALVYGLCRVSSHVLSQALSRPDPTFGISNGTGSWLQDVKVRVCYVEYADEKRDATITCTVQKGMSPMPPSRKLYIEVPTSDITLDSVSFQLGGEGFLFDEHEHASRGDTVVLSLKRDGVIEICYEDPKGIPREGIPKRIRRAKRTSTSSEN